eukprot:TRINITY_DN496_c2_g1_i1.p1 TRINITY_DN496_c2_g1~~TRINITY_DN496_c2_g1_i1.p1  ORF type:complete len:275 (+),score=57.71 TRINITY_DN496_c2_g1_i1:365-1189(+)
MLIHLSFIFVMSINFSVAPAITIMRWDEVAFCFTLIGCAAFIAGVPVCIVYSLKWKASVEYERESVEDTCTVLTSEVETSCKDKYGKVLGHKWTYTVKTSQCGDKVLCRTDDTCNKNPLPVGLVRDCRIHFNCESFKWRSKTEVNRVGSIVGGGVIGISLILLGISIGNLYKKHKKAKSLSAWTPPVNNVFIEVPSAQPPHPLREFPHKDTQLVSDEGRSHKETQTASDKGRGVFIHKDPSADGLDDHQVGMKVLDDSSHNQQVATHEAGYRLE